MGKLQLSPREREIQKRLMESDILFEYHNIEKLSIEDLHELYSKCCESECVSKIESADIHCRDNKYFDIQKIVVNMPVVFFHSMSSLEQTIKTSTRLVAPDTKKILQTKKNLEYPNGDSETDSQEDCVIAEEFTQEEQPIHLDLARRERSKNYRVSKLAQFPMSPMQSALQARGRSYTTAQPRMPGSKSKPVFIKNLPLRISNDLLKDPDQMLPKCIQSNKKEYYKERTFDENLAENSQFPNVDSFETVTAKNTPIKPYVDNNLEEQKTPMLKKFKICLLSNKQHTPLQTLRAFDKSNNPNKSVQPNSRDETTPLLNLAAAIAKAASPKKCFPQGFVLNKSTCTLKLLQRPFQKNNHKKVTINSPQCIPLGAINWHPQYSTASKESENKSVFRRIIRGSNIKVSFSKLIGKLLILIREY